MKCTSGYGVPLAHARDTHQGARLGFKAGPAFELLARAGAPLRVMVAKLELCWAPYGFSGLSLLRDHSQPRLTHRATLFVGAYPFVGFVPLVVGPLLHIRSQALWYAGSVCF